MSLVIRGPPVEADSLRHHARGAEDAVRRVPTFYRIEKDFKRQGVPVSRSTMNELFHRAAQMLRPLSDRLLEQIRHRDIVLADETRLRMQDGGEGKPKTGFQWTFVAEDDHDGTHIGFVFAASRSGETPRQILGGTTGTLLVDAYSGYNSVADVSSRERAACHAHLRRYFHESLSTAPCAQEAIDLILTSIAWSTKLRSGASSVLTHTVSCVSSELDLCAIN